MGVDLYISRAPFWAENEGKEITLEEWRNFAQTDPELVIADGTNDGFVRWRGLSTYDDPWLDWFQGNIITKWPDTALYRKMLVIARALHATVQDDDGKTYITENDWNFTPHLNP